MAFQGKGKGKGGGEQEKQPGILGGCRAAVVSTRRFVGISGWINK